MIEKEEYSCPSGEEEEGEYRVHWPSFILLMAAIALCAFFSVQVMTKGYVSIGGCSVFRVVTGSMEPEIPTGAILINKKTDISEIRVGDIVCYRTRVSEIRGAVVTHRVVAIGTGEDGRLRLETRGDANVSSDPFYVTAEDLIGRVTWHSGKESVLTNMLSFLSGKIGFLACIVFPILLIAGLILQNSVKNIQRDLILARYELKRGPVAERQKAPDPAELLPGYSGLTYSDYEEIYEALKKELLEATNGDLTETDTKTE